MIFRKRRLFINLTYIESSENSVFEVFGFLQNPKPEETVVSGVFGIFLKIPKPAKIKDFLGFGNLQFPKPIKTILFYLIAGAAVA